MLALCGQTWWRKPENPGKTTEPGRATTTLPHACMYMYINDISADIESEIRLFADDYVCFREIKNEEDTLKLQRDIGRLGSWARIWGMRFQPVKCNMMQLTNKWSSKIQANYTLEGTLLENAESIKYLSLSLRCERSIL